MRKIDKTYRKPGKRLALRILRPLIPAFGLVLLALSYAIISLVVKFDFQGSLSVSALVIALGSLAYQFTQDYRRRANEVLETEMFHHFKRETIDLVLLKALIRLRISSDPIDLAKLHSTDPQLFDREKLVNRLFD